MRIQRASQREGIPWKNGKGICFGIINSTMIDGKTNPLVDGFDEWSWELSTANIDVEDVEFSSFPGIHRTFCVAQGNLYLTIDDQDKIYCEEGSISYFQGDSKTFAHIISNHPVKALNLLTRVEKTQKKIVKREFQMFEDNDLPTNCDAIVAISESVVILINGIEKVELLLLDSIIDLNIGDIETLNLLFGKVAFVTSI